VDFELSDEQTMLRDASRSLLSDHSASGDVRSLIDTDIDVDPKFWQLATELGWSGLALPEEYGGSEQGLTELAVIAEEIGRAVGRGPFLPSVIAGLAVTRAATGAVKSEVLPHLAEGSASAAVALDEPRRRWSSGDVRSTATREPDGSFRLTARKTAVQDAGSARWIVVSAELPGETALFLVGRESTGVSVRRQSVLDVTRSLYEVVLDDVTVPAGELIGGADLAQRLYDDGAVLTCADALGAGERLLAMTVEYAKVRVQFGRAIGSFQAVKHKCATMRMQLQGARAATYYAAMAADAGAPDASRAASVAKAYVSEAMSALAGEALQVHGGIGFTWEHDLHLYLRRIKVDEVLFGDPRTHQERLCALLLAARSLDTNV
jgi:alkylation response protein AidB-like acyl-CoA dehydrogenase